VCVCVSGDFAIGSIILIIAIQFYSCCSLTSPDDDDVDTEQRPSSRPGILSIEARSKYDAWLETQSLTKQEAREEYVKLALELVGEPVQKLIDTA
jgi:Acyl CoA binding protein